MNVGKVIFIIFFIYINPLIAEEKCAPCSDGCRCDSDYINQSNNEKEIFLYKYYKDFAICNEATTGNEFIKWDPNPKFKKAIREARRRNLSCDVGNKRIIKKDNFEDNNLKFEKEKRLELEHELAAIKKNQKEKQKSINTDIEKPLISTFTKQNESNVIVSGRVTDNIEVAEVLIDGQAQQLSSNGTFKTEFYIPRTGKIIEIVAFDTKGNKASKTMKIERSNIQQVNVQQFKSLNPSLKTVKSNPNALALIIGISDYENTKASALYADSDAKTFYDYATMKLGIPSSNIKELINDGADRIDITRAIKTWLLKRTIKDKTDIYVFFAGHGLATDDGKGMYLLPYDGVPDLLEDSAIRRKELFADIQATKPRSVTVFLDTCYSGGTRNEETLVASLRPVLITAKEQSVPANFTVLSAAQGNQTSQSLEEAKHGLFSYYMMLGMEGGADLNADNKITARELHEYVVDKVERQSQFRQTPELQGNKDRVLVRFN
ncbi:caspase family protein [Alphaproteobacteria bacterium]|nr:caspase family protein [Alphaproteobacteria bacterium]